MKIGVIGSGNIGSTVARLLAGAGHEIAIANSRGPDSLTDLVAELGERAQAATVEDAALFGELVLVAIPLGRVDELPPAPFAGKVVIDANNYYSSRDGEIPELESDETTSSELLERHLPDATVVKAFNTMQWEVLRDSGRPDSPREDRLALFVAGDDPPAKRRVMGLIEEIGFAAVDTGSLAEGGRRQQPGSPIHAKLVTPSEGEAALAGLGDTRPGR